MKKYIQGIRSGSLKTYGWRFVTLYRRWSPKKKKCGKEKWLPEEALKIAEKIREVKGKGERERYTQWNVDFQRIARGYKKVFISEQCKI